MRHMLTKYLLLRLLFVSSLSFAMPLLAGELKIVDKHGLVRAIKTIQDHATVTVNVKATQERVVLARTDGIAAEIVGEPRGAEPIYIFSNVSDGVWIVKGNDPVSIVAVVIEPHDR